MSAATAAVMIAAKSAATTVAMIAAIIATMARRTGVTAGRRMAAPERAR